MMKITLVALFFAVTITLRAQTLWTPGGSVGDNTLNGNVGIGTNTPGRKLEVNGDIKLNFISNNAEVIFIGNQISGLSYSLRNIRGGVSNVGFEIYDISNSAARLVIDGSGNVGIGTTSPSYLLHVNGTGMFEGQLLSNKIRTYNNAHQAGANDYNLELYSEDTGDPNKFVSIRFHQSNQYWGQVRYNNNGFRFTHGADDNLDNLTVANLYSLSKIGIGTTSPVSKLTISQQLADNSNLVISTIQREASATGGSLIFRLGYYGYSDIEQNGMYSGSGIRYGTYGDLNLVNNGYGTYGGINFVTQSNVRVTVCPNGNVLIGKTSQSNNNYKLDVAGKIRADEVVVNTTGADFVFEPGYNLMKLGEIQQFIKENIRLPGIASAEEMQKEGMNMSEMQTKLLQKIEEITLYLIELNNENEKIKSELNELKSTLRNQ